MQRRLVCEFRERVLCGEDTGLLAEQSSEQLALLEARFGQAHCQQVERSLVLNRIDAAWSNHLARVSEARDLMPLSSVGALSTDAHPMAGWSSMGRESPLAIYERQVSDHFVAFEREWESGVVELFERLGIGESGLDLSELERDSPDPGATWTYLVNERAYASKTPALIRDLRARWADWRA